MGPLRVWLLGVIGVAVLTALADSVMPPGAVKRVGKLVCGLALLAALLSPLPGFELSSGTQWIEKYMLLLETDRALLDEQRERQMKAVMEEEFAAYISDKAAQMGVECHVTVTCRAAGDGVFLPERAEITGPLTASVQAELGRLLVEELEIPEENQSYTTEEGAA